jgi:hypothetical protein
LKESVKINHVKKDEHIKISGIRVIIKVSTYLIQNKRREPDDIKIILVNSFEQRTCKNKTRIRPKFQDCEDIGFDSRKYYFLLREARGKTADLK